MVEKGEKAAREQIETEKEEPERKIMEDQFNKIQAELDHCHDSVGLFSKS